MVHISDCHYCPWKAAMGIAHLYPPSRPADPLGEPIVYIADLWWMNFTGFFYFVFVFVIGRCCLRAWISAISFRHRSHPAQFELLNPQNHTLREFSHQKAWIRILPMRRRLPALHILELARNYKRFSSSRYTSLWSPMIMRSHCAMRPCSSAMCSSCKELEGVASIYSVILIIPDLDVSVIWVVRALAWPGRLHKGKKLVFVTGTWLSILGVYKRRSLRPFN